MTSPLTQLCPLPPKLERWRDDDNADDDGEGVWDGAAVINNCCCHVIRQPETSGPLQTIVHVHTQEHSHARAASLRFRITALNLHSNSPHAAVMLSWWVRERRRRKKRKKKETREEEKEELPEERAQDRKAKNVPGRHTES